MSDLDIGLTSGSSGGYDAAAATLISQSVSPASVTTGWRMADNEGVLGRTIGHLLPLEITSKTMAELAANATELKAFLENSDAFDYLEGESLLENGLIGSASAANIIANDAALLDLILSSASLPAVFVDAASLTTRQALLEAAKDRVAAISQVTGLYSTASPNSLYQERTGAAATTPASSGDPIGTIKDLSGSGNHLTAIIDDTRRSTATLESGLLHAAAGAGDGYQIPLAAVSSNTRIFLLVRTTGGANNRGILVRGDVAMQGIFRSSDITSTPISDFSGWDAGGTLITFSSSRGNAYSAMATGAFVANEFIGGDLSGWTEAYLLDSNTDTFWDSVYDLAAAVIVDESTTALTADELALIRNYIEVERLIVEGA